MSGSILRPLALLAAASIAVHDLRYLLAFGDDAGHVLADQGHAYMATLSPLVGGLLTIGFARLVLGAAAGASGAPVSRIRARRVWPLAALALLTIFSVQELLEGMFATGHPSGWSGVFGHGGWLAIALSLALGGVVALAMRVAKRLEAGAPIVRAPRWIAAPPQVGMVSAGERRVRRRLLAQHLAGRGPPARSA